MYPPNPTEYQRLLDELAVAEQVQVSVPVPSGHFLTFFLGQDFDDAEVWNWFPIPLCHLSDDIFSFLESFMNDKPANGFWNKPNAEDCHKAVSISLTHNIATEKRDNVSVFQLYCHL